MKLSVIIVSYNEEKYLREAIESCLHQTYQDYELIIGDDGSSDHSWQIISEYTERYPECIRSFKMERDVRVADIIPPLRVSNVVRRALSMVSGEYVAVLSGDDLFCSETWFEKAILILESEKYGSRSACVAGFKKFWDSGKTISFRPHRYPSKIYWGGVYVHLSCFLFRRSVADDLLERFCDDTGLQFSMVLNGNYVWLDETVFAYRQREGSIMRKADELELALLELLLYQDVSLKGRYKLSSLARFSRPLNYVYRHRQEMDDNYLKYYTESAKFKYDYINKIKNIDSDSFAEKLLFKIKLGLSTVLHFEFLVARKAVALIDKIIGW